MLSARMLLAGNACCPACEGRGQNLYAECRFQSRLFPEVCKILDPAWEFRCRSLTTLIPSTLLMLRTSVWEYHQLTAKALTNALSSTGSKPLRLVSQDVRGAVSTIPLASWWRILGSIRKDEQRASVRKGV